jgi:hypothetical protein
MKLYYKLTIGDSSQTIDYRARVMSNIIQPLFNLLLDAHKRIGDLEVEVKNLKSTEEESK